MIIHGCPMIFFSLTAMYVFNCFFLNKNNNENEFTPKRNLNNDGRQSLPYLQNKKNTTYFHLIKSSFTYRQGESRSSLLFVLLYFN